MLRVSLTARTGKNIQGLSSSSKLETSQSDENNSEIFYKYRIRKETIAANGLILESRKNQATLVLGEEETSKEKRGRTVSTISKG